MLVVLLFIVYAIVYARVESHFYAVVDICELVICLKQ